MSLMFSSLPYILQVYKYIQLVFDFKIFHEDIILTSSAQLLPTMECWPMRVYCMVFDRIKMMNLIMIIIFYCTLFLRV